MRGRSARPLDLALAATPGVMTFLLALRQGGYFPGSVALAAAEAALLLALIVVTARRPAGGWGLPLAAAALALGALAAWALASSSWSHAPGRALAEYDRILFYLLLVVAFGTLGYKVERVRWMLYGLVGGIAAVCALAVASRAFPDLVGTPPVLAPERLSYPLSYWNGLGLLAGIGVILAGHMAADGRAAALARVAGSAAVPVMAVVVYLTLSRGAVWATAGGLVLYLLLARPREGVTAALSTAPSTLALLLLVDVPTAAVMTQSYAGDAHLAVLVVACSGAAAAARAGLLPADRMLARLPDVPAVAFRGAALGLAVIVAAGSFALGVPGVLHAKVAEFGSRERTASAEGPERLLSSDSNGRRELWHVALASFVDEPAHGTGAGTFPLRYAQQGVGSVSVQDAHSLYAETLGELGLVGAGALGVALTLVLGAFANRARGRDRALFAALLAAGLAWAAHAAIDWDWELPAVTLWVFAFGGAALASERSQREHAPRLRWLGSAGRLAAVAACLVVAMAPARVALAEARLEQGLAALNRGDCPTAVERASASLAAQGDSARPHHVRGFCEINAGRWGGAVREMAAAVRLDPENWEIRHGLAVALAGAGQDPMGQARRAARLNPRGDLAEDTLREFEASARRGWRKVAREAPLAPP